MLRQRRRGGRWAGRRGLTLLLGGVLWACDPATAAVPDRAAVPFVAATMVAGPRAAPASAAAAPEPRGGYWLGVELLGPAAAQHAAVVELSEGLTLQDPAEAPPPGIMVGHVGEVNEALRWIARFAFEPRPTLPAHPRALQRVPAPAPAGGLLDRHGATLAAFVVSGATPDLRARTIEWPLEQSAILPAGSTWLPGALVPTRAPLFAAPSPSVPAAAEAHAMAHRKGGLFVLSWVDRCEDAPLRCLRWAQVVVRDGDRFSPGYLPMFQVALRTSWVRGEGALPRAQLIASRIVDQTAQFVLLARGRDNQLRRRTLTTQAKPHGWPHASLNVDGDRAIVILGDDPPLRLALDPTLDARPKSNDPASEASTDH